VKFPQIIMLKVLRWVLMGATLLAAAGATHFWTAKRTQATEMRRYVSRFRPVEIHRFELLEYCYRPILVWRSDVQGGRPAHVEYTYGAYAIEEMRRIEWCGSGRGVLVEAIVKYDYGESRRIRIFYDFQKGSLVTTLDFRTTDAELNAAVGKCRAE